MKKQINKLTLLSEAISENDNSKKKIKLFQKKFRRSERIAKKKSLQ